MYFTVIEARSCHISCMHLRDELEYLQGPREASAAFFESAGFNNIDMLNLNWRTQRPMLRLNGLAAPT
jgi:hypothetical protein